MILGERCKLSHRVLDRGQDADDFGRFLMKLDPYNYMVLQTYIDGARGVYTGGSGSSCFQAELGGIKFPPPAS